MPERILVVDDNRYAADALARIVSMIGYQVSAVYSGEEAVIQAAEFSPHLALIDIGMAGMDGYETVKLIRRRRLNPRPILVAVTAWARHEDKRRAYESGFDLHVAKPISLETIGELLALVDPASPRPDID